MPSAKPFLTELVADTLNRQETFVHGDFSPKNILIYQHKPILLDHEVAHFGDPAFDLGFSLTHLLSKAHHLPSNRFILFDAALRYWDTYFGLVRESPWTTGLEHRAVKHTSACLLARAVGRSPLEYFFFQAEDGIRDSSVTGVQTCALPISIRERSRDRYRYRLRTGRKTHG